MIALPMTPQAPHLCHQQADTSSDPSPSQRYDQSSNPGLTSPSSTAPSTMLSIVAPPMPGSPSASAQRRPKLSLKTDTVPRTFGKSTTALSLSLTIPTPSPTVRNTFANAYDLPRRGSPSSPSSNASLSRTRPTSRLVSPYTSNEQPYQLPLGLKSILRNSPIPALARRQSLSASVAGTRRFFPPQKRVTYRYPLEEEIKTVHFITRHSDLSSDEESRSDSDASIASSYSSSSDSSSEDDERERLSKKKRKSRSKRQVYAAGLRDLKDVGDEGTPATPVQTRKRRRREWRWTLGPILQTAAEDAESTSVQETAVEVSGEREELPYSVNDIPLPPVTAAEVEALQDRSSLGREAENGNAAAVETSAGSEDSVEAIPLEGGQGMQCSTGEADTLPTYSTEHPPKVASAE